MGHYTFKISGKCLPQEHGYHLLAGLSKIEPSLHDKEKVQILQINGRRDERRKGIIHVVDNSQLQIRNISLEEAGRLAGSEISVDGYRICIGAYREYRIAASPLLASARVIFDMTDKEITPASFLEALKAYLSPEVLVELGRSTSLPLPKENTKKEKKGVDLKGFVVRLANVPPDLSVALQEQGVGTHKSMGCGIFYPGSPKIWARIYAHD